MQKYEHIKEFEVKYCDVDFKDDIKLSAVLSYFEEVAGSSADELGFGYKHLKPKNMTFMLSGICCEFYESVKQGDTVAFKTWPLPPSYVIFGREYEIVSPKDGRIMCSATSRWCLVDLEDGKILNSKTIGDQDYSTYNISRALEWNHWKIPQFAIEDGELRYSMTVANSEYDHNMHVNNTRYADYCLNCFSVDELKKSFLKRFQISYCKQCREGDCLGFYRKKNADGGYTVCGVNEKEETVVLSRFFFENS